MLRRMQSLLRARKSSLLGYHGLGMDIGGGVVSRIPSRWVVPNGDGASRGRCMEIDPARLYACQRISKNNAVIVESSPQDSGFHVALKVYLFHVLESCFLLEAKNSVAVLTAEHPTSYLRRQGYVRSYMIPKIPRTLFPRSDY